MDAPAPASPAAPAPLAVELERITKRFPGVLANDRVDLQVRRGEIHAVVGENGAGKSTLMSILYGMQRPDAGTVRAGGRELHLRSPRDAIAAGIGMVHQHFMLADHLTVLENVVIGAEPRRGLRLDRPEAARRIGELSRAYGMPIDPAARVEDLGVGQRQRVEILKVLYRGARVLILDEPTAVLVPQEVRELFRNLRALAAEGHTVVLISHKLDEVLEVAEAITVMRRGRAVAEVEAAGVDRHRLAELMVGSDLPRPEPRAQVEAGPVVLSCEGLGVRDARGRWLVEGVDLAVRRGEIVGVAGVEGNGQATLVEAILGLVPADAGRVVLAGRDVTGATTRERRQAGIAYVPEDRQRQGLLLSQPLWENAALGYQAAPPFCREPWFDRAAARERALAVIAGFDVRTPGPDVAAHALSGGNQQKFIVGRELLARPALLLAAHPTRGVDVGAHAAVWAELRAAAGAGLGVLLVSADLEELIGLSDRLVVMLRGRLTARLDPATVTGHELGAAMTGSPAHAEGG